MTDRDETSGSGPQGGGAGRTYDALAGRPVHVDAWSLERHERETSSGFTRKTTVFVAEGVGHVGRGEDVTYDAEDHDQLTGPPPGLPVGDATLDAASTALESVDLFPAGAPQRPVSRRYRRWAVESALLDLALRQDGADLGEALGRPPAPVRFVVSTSLGDPPSTAPVERWLDVDPALEFKVDVTAPLPEGVLEALVGTGRVRTVDLKAHYGPPTDEQSHRGQPEPDPAFYRALLEAFPAATFEDPAVTDATRPVLEPEVHRLSWDAPIHAVDEFEAMPLAVGRCNVKPSRFGTLERLFDFLDFADRTGLERYGGGQFELSVGRGQLHELASRWYPDGPNDVAPAGYNDPELDPGLPGSPLAPPADPAGFRWD